jgi:hypothetical protein
LADDEENSTSMPSEITAPVTGIRSLPTVPCEAPSANSVIVPGFGGMTGGVNIQFVPAGPQAI